MALTHIKEFLVDPVGLYSYEQDDYFCLEVSGGLFSNRNRLIDNIDQWCGENLGPGGRMMTRVAGTAVWPKEHRWYRGGNRFWFNSELDRTVVVLAWSQ
jgi:hypothetical protein